MSWRAGLEIYLEFLPIIDKYERHEETRNDLKADLMKLFLDYDIDPGGLEEDPDLAPIYAHMESRLSEPGGQ